MLATPQNKCGSGREHVQFKTIRRLIPATGAILELEPFLLSEVNQQANTDTDKYYP